MRVALSSEAPVERFDWWTGERYLEVLDHGPGGIDLTYARDGLPFLLDHQQRVQVGLLEDVVLDKDRKLRATITMGNHPDAAWVGRDIADGIRKKVSVGYNPGETYRQEEGKGTALPTRIYTGWRIYEGSSVSIPADYDVGIARSAFEGRAGTAHQSLAPSSRKAKENPMPEGTQDAGAAAAGGSASVGRDHDAERKQRQAAIANICKLASNPADGGSIAMRALAEDWSAEQTASAVGEANIKRAGETVPAGQVGLSQKEEKRYSILRALRMMAAEPGDKRARDEGGFELEVSQTIATAMGRQPRGLYIPLHLSYDRQMAAQARAAITGNVVGTTSLGGAGVETSVQSMIEYLRNEAVLGRIGARFLTGLTGNITFPRQITTNTFTWEGENPSTAKSLTAATLDNVTLSPKTGFNASAYSKNLLVQSSFGVEQFVREDLAAGVAVGIDAAGINGSGSSNQPTGILNTSGIGTEVMGTNGAVLAWANVVSYETKAALANSRRGRMGYLTTPGIRGKLKQTLRLAAATSADYIWTGGLDGQVNEYPAYASNNVPSNLTKGTSTTICHGVIFGDFSEVLIGVWGDAVDVVVDPYTYSTQGMVQVVQMTMVDVGHRHPATMIVTKDALV